MKIEKTNCDICGKKDIQEQKKSQSHKGMQVIFTTEQNEGRLTEPYLDSVNIDICDECVEKVLKGNYIFASGCMGNNNYSFKDQDMKYKKLYYASILEKYGVETL